MPTHSGKRHPPTTRRRALELLAASRDGCTEAILLAHGFSIDMLVELVNGGLATTAGNKPMNVTFVRITDAGRQALVGRGKP